MPILRTLACLLLWLVALSTTGFSQKPSSNRPRTEKAEKELSRNDRYGLLWEISGNGLEAPSYLFGTSHLRDWRAFDFPDSLPIVFRACDAAAFELHPDSAFEVFLNPPRWAVNNPHFDENRWEIDRSQAPNRFGVSSTAYQLPFSLMQDGIFNRNTEEGDSLAKCFMDIYLFDLATLSEKKIFGLETIWSQTYCHQWGDTIAPPYFEWPDSSAAATKKPRRKKNGYEVGLWRHDKGKAIQIYLQGDIEQLLQGESEYFDETEKQYFIARNYVMARSMDSIMRHHRLFATMGCAHFGGPKGVIQMLRGMGYTVRAMSPTFEDDGMAFEQHGDERTPRIWKPAGAHFSMQVFQTPFLLRNDYRSEAKTWIIPDEPNALSAYVVEFPLYLPSSHSSWSAFWIGRLLKKLQKEHLDPERLPRLTRAATEDIEIQPDEPAQPSPKRRRDKLSPVKTDRPEKQPGEETDAAELWPDNGPTIRATANQPAWDTLLQDSLVAYTCTFPGKDNWHKLRICSDGHHVWLLAVTSRDSCALLRREVGAFFEHFQPERTPEPTTPGPIVWSGLQLPFGAAQAQTEETPLPTDRSRFVRLRSLNIQRPDGPAFFLRAHDLPLGEVGQNNPSVLSLALEPFGHWLGAPRKRKDKFFFQEKYPAMRHEFRMDSANRLCTMAFRNGTRVYTLAILSNEKGWNDPAVRSTLDSITVLPADWGELSEHRVDSAGLSLPFPEGASTDGDAPFPYLLPDNETIAKHWALQGHDPSSGAHFVATVHTFNPFSLPHDRDSSMLAWTQDNYPSLWQHLVYSNAVFEETSLQHWAQRDTLPDGTPAITFSGQDTTIGLSMLSRASARGDRFFTWHVFYPTALDSQRVRKDFLAKMVFLDSLLPDRQPASVLKSRILEALSGSDSLRMTMAKQCLHEVTWAPADTTALCQALENSFLHFQWNPISIADYTELLLQLDVLDTLPCRARDSLYWKLFLQLNPFSELSKRGLEKLVEHREVAAFDTLFTRKNWSLDLTRSQLGSLVEQFCGDQQINVDTSVQALLRRPELMVITLAVLASRKRDVTAQRMVMAHEHRLVHWVDSLHDRFFQSAEIDGDGLWEWGWEETMRHDWDAPSLEVDTLYQAAEQIREALIFWLNRKTLTAETESLLITMAGQSATPFCWAKALHVLIAHGYTAEEPFLLERSEQQPAWMHRVLAALAGKRARLSLPARFLTEEFGRSLMEAHHLSRYPKRRLIGVFLRYVQGEEAPMRFYVHLCRDEDDAAWLAVSPGYPENPGLSKVFYSEEEYRIIEFSAPKANKKTVGALLEEEGYFREKPESYFEF